MSELETKEEGTMNVQIYSKGITKANYHIVRGYRRKEKYIRLETTEGTITISDIKARRQFLNQLGLGLRDMERVWDYNERNQKITDAIQDRATAELTDKKKPLVFRCHPSDIGGTYLAWSIVTSDYVEVPSKEAIEYFENVLAKKGYGDSKLQKQWDSGKAVYNVYSLWESPTKPVKVGDLASCNVVLRAGYSGDRSVGLSGGYTILACTNGMTNNKQVTAYRGIHRGMTKEAILNKVEDAFNEVLIELPMIETLVEEAQDPLTEEEEKEMLDKILEKYPLHIQDQIKKAMKKYADTQGKFRISQAVSDTASHYPNATESYRNELEKEAFRVLTVPVPKKKKKEERTS